MKENLIQSLFVPERIQAALHSLKSAPSTSFEVVIIWRPGKLRASHIDTIFNGLSSPPQALLFPLLPHFPCACVFMFLLLSYLLPNQLSLKYLPVTLPEESWTSQEHFYLNSTVSSLNSFS